jgi:hypothetical protein
VTIEQNSDASSRRLPVFTGTDQTSSASPDLVALHPSWSSFPSEAGGLGKDGAILYADRNDNSQHHDGYIFYHHRVLHARVLQYATRARGAAYGAAV